MICDIEAHNHAWVSLRIIELLSESRADEAKYIAAEHDIPWPEELEF